MFADNAKLYYPIRTLHVRSPSLQQDLANLVDWYHYIIGGECPSM